jgi:flavin-dependent dehydrogenase
MLLARRGLRVLVVDRAARGSDTLSTHALMRGGVMQLARWGLLDRLAAVTPPVRMTTFHYGEQPVAVAIKPKFGVDALYGPRRTVLDALLVSAAEEAGADVAFGVRLLDLVRTSGGRVSGALIEGRGDRRRLVLADLVIGADGLRSTVARLVGARPTRVSAHGGAVIYGYWAGVPVDGYHWHYRPGVSAGAIPTNGGLTCVFAAMPASRFMGDLRFRAAEGYREVLGEAAPALAAALERATLVGALRGFAGDPGIVRESHGPGWALVGDAGYFRDPITAHGITDAFRDAEVLAAAVMRGGESALRDYETTRDEMAGPLFEVTDRVASFDWDLDELQRLHRALSEEMVREAEWIAGLEPWPAARASADGAGGAVAVAAG